MAEDMTAKEAVIKQFGEDLAARDPFLVATRTLQLAVDDVSDAIFALVDKYQEERPGAYMRLNHLEAADSLEALATRLTYSVARIRQFTQTS